MPLAIPLSVVAGWVMDMGFPDRDWWPLALVGAGLNTEAVDNLLHAPTFRYPPTLYLT